MPVISGGVYYHAGGGKPNLIYAEQFDEQNKRVPNPPVRDTWLSWLAEQTHFAYVHDGLSFTARREKRRNTTYWYAYKKVNGKTRGRYIGTDSEVTPERLHTIARAFRAESA
jgi:hypothetical protein